jgi:hypothetical protein
MDAQSKLRMRTVVTLFGTVLVVSLLLGMIYRHDTAISWTIVVVSAMFSILLCMYMYKTKAAEAERSFALLSVLFVLCTHAVSLSTEADIEWIWYPNIFCTVVICAYIYYPLYTIYLL